MPILISPAKARKLHRHADASRPDARTRLQLLLAQSREAMVPTKRLAFLLLDIDEFQRLLDLCGPADVDLLRQIVVHDRLSRLRDSHNMDWAAGTFVCLIPFDDDSELAMSIDWLRKILAEPMWIDRYIVHLTASIGVVIAHDADGADDLLHAASLALSQAQREGENMVRRFKPYMFDDLHARAALESDFRGGLLRGQIVPFYQPIVTLSTGVPKGFEALARWLHPRLGILAPDRFLSVASDMKLSDEMLLLLLRQVCSNASEWPVHLTVSINVAPTQLCDPQLTQKILRIIYASGLDPRRLTIEITEDAPFENPAMASEAIQCFRKAGLSIALDDFGTGHASFDRLSHLEIDQLKIDRKLVQAMDKDRGRKLVQGIANLGRSLSMEVTAEGIETPEQARLAREADCHWGQGYLFGKAVPADAARTLALSHENKAPENAAPESKATPEQITES